MHQQMASEAAAEAIKSAPPLAVMAAASSGFGLQDWVFILTLVYLCVQIGWLLWRWWRAASVKGWRPK